MRATRPNGSEQGLWAELKRSSDLWSLISRLEQTLDLAVPGRAVPKSIAGFLGNREKTRRTVNGAKPCCKGQGGEANRANSNGKVLTWTHGTPSLPAQ